MSSKQPILHPYFVTGFSDAESYFYIGINRSTKMNTGWSVNLQFGINLHKKDRYLLELIKAILNGVGNIVSQEKENIQYRVSSIKDLQVIVDHFNKFPLLTKKRADYELLIKVLILIKRKEHLTYEGLRQIIVLKAAMNLGLSAKLKTAFPDVVRVERPLVELPLSIDPYWLAGFTSGEGSFMVKITASKTHSVGFQVTLVFVIGQHKRDEKLLKLLIEYFDCGNIYKNGDAFDFRVSKFNDIIKIIIPFFLQYPIHGVKALDFKDFCLVAEMMKEKKHLTQEGLELIRKIKAGMNRGRKLD